MRFFLLIILLSFSFPLLSQRRSPEQLQTVNTSYDEQNPVLSPDGNSLYFTVGNHPANTGGKKDPGDIWISRREGTQWMAPVHGGSLLNDRAYNAVAGFSADGQQLFLHGHYGTSGSVAKTQGISVSRNSGGTWSRPDNITIPYFLNKSGTLCGALSDDNTVFIFSAESYGTYGVDDIYVSIRQGEKWSEPKNIGGSINTQFQELSPSLSADNKTLFFSSNGRKGSGSFDIFSTTRLDESWTSWSTPVNLGPSINSDGRELYFRMYTPLGFGIYTSTKSSDGYGDMKIYVPDVPPLPGNDSLIYASLQRETVLEKLKPVEENVPEVVSPVKAGVKAEVKVFGKITSAKTGEVVPAARISFDSPDRAGETISAGDNGYAVAVPSSAYVIRIEAPGYISTMEKLDINAAEMQEVEMNFKLQPVEVGTTVNLKNVLFAQTKTDILPESFSELDLVVSFLKENPKVKIELLGHTDGRGVHADNVKLSQQRVNKVKQYLVSKGIEGNRISGKGFGGSKPIASNDTEESRKMNRRVEFVIRKF
jgi:outer membrane protein OmpA-like peptidoglycan-associated protein